MNGNITIFEYQVSMFIYAPLLFLLWIGSFMLLKKILYKRIQMIASRTESQLDDIILDSLNTPLNIIMITSGLLFLQKNTPLRELINIDKYLFLGVRLTAIVAGIIFLDRFLRKFVTVYSDKIDIFKTSGGMVKGVIRVVIYGLGLLVVLDSFGVSITPFLASLGIGSLAVALALQPTLENLFSGIQLVADKPVQIGQFIKLESGEEGFVERIGWRSTWIKLPQNNIIVIPNKVLVNSKVLNYEYPDKEVIVPVEIGVHYDSDLAHVEKVAVDVASAVMKNVEGGIPHFAPVVRFKAFNDSSIGMAVVMRAKDMATSHIIRHEFVKMCHKRFAKEGIVIPYPIRAINYSQEKTGEAK